MNVSVVVPVFNAESTIRQLVEELIAVLATGADRFEVVLVDDGSADGSWTQIEALVTAHSAVRAIRLARNVGEQGAVVCGLRAARYEATITLDDDLQQPPSEIPLLLEALEGADLVYGTPRRVRDRRGRVMVTRGAKFILEHARLVPRATAISSFRAFKTALREHIEVSAGPADVVDAALMRATTKVAAVRVRHDHRASGGSNYSSAMRVAHGVDLVTAFSVRPLRWAWWWGVGLMVAAILALLGILGGLLVGARPGAAAVLAVGASILVGLQLLALGILGEYVARIHLRLLGGPAFVVADVIGDAP